MDWNWKMMFKVHPRTWKPCELDDASQTKKTSPEVTTTPRTAATGRDFEEVGVVWMLWMPCRGGPGDLETWGHTLTPTQDRDRTGHRAGRARTSRRRCSSFHFFCCFFSTFLRSVASPSARAAKAHGQLLKTPKHRIPATSTQHSFHTAAPHTQRAAHP